MERLRNGGPLLRQEVHRESGAIRAVELRGALFWPLQHPRPEKTPTRGLLQPRKNRRSSTVREILLCTPCLRTLREETESERRFRRESMARPWKRREATRIFPLRFFLHFRNCRYEPGRRSSGLRHPDALSRLERPFRRDGWFPPRTRRNEFRVALRESRAAVRCRC